MTLINQEIILTEYSFTEDTKHWMKSNRYKTYNILMIRLSKQRYCNLNI